MVIGKYTQCSHEKCLYMENGSRYALSNGNVCQNSFMD